MQINSNRALWRTYIFVVSFSCLVAGAFLYLKWLDVKETATVQQTYANKLIANSIENFLNKYEAFLGVLGDKILNQISRGEILSAQKELDGLMQNNPELAGLGFSEPDGNWLVMTSNLLPYKHNQTLINLKDYKDTGYSFKSAMEHQIGRAHV